MANRKGRRRSFGSVRLLASGRWQVRYRDPETGLLRPAENTYETKTDAQVSLTHIEADITRGQWADPDAGAVNFADYATAWLRDRKLADRTRERNESVMGCISSPPLARAPSPMSRPLGCGVGAADCSQRAWGSPLWSRPTSCYGL